MFTIDLLKGERIPLKSRPEGVAIGTLTFVVPIIAAIVMFGFYLNNSIAMSIQKRNIMKYEEKAYELSGAVKLQKSLEKEKSAINSCLSEVSSSIDRHTQWSGILTTLAKHMPDSMVLTRLEVKQRSVTKRVPSKADPEKMMSINIPVRTLHINVCGSAQFDCDRAVKDFKDRLRASPLVGPKLEAIKVSQEFATLEGQEVVCYGIDCVFKAGL